ncbi:hypothetical protein L1D32_04775 [Shewanella insulae]|uniref:hypothetical protein n=1 Tax=Shewanella insulae TaxID=2681496 RepID=UPI001EFC4553|nr:hypothetical protein [Shewanella insulae]MCG9737473.1 hypothetical protein [Shewanella insulae]
MAREQHFNKGTVRLLGERVGYLCSNPDCRKVTIGPKVGELNTIRIGEAAHICAESPGGARFDVSMTSAERVHYDNGIWLCRNCHTMVDRDESVYPVEMLRNWKEVAENKSNEELGVKHPTNDDAINQLATAFTGQAQKFYPEAIENVHSASHLVLENIDPRFSVTTEFKEGKTSLTLLPKENVDLGLSIKSDEKNKIRWQKLIEHGEDFVSSTHEVNIVGSELFDFLSKGREGRITLKGHRVASTVRLQIKKDNGELLDSFYDIHGFIRFGTQTFTFTGDACNGFFLLKLRRSNYLEDTTVSLNLSLKMDAWDGIDLQRLPYFDKVYNFFSNLSKGNLVLWLDYDGNNILESKVSGNNDLEGVSDIFMMLSYIDRCRKVAKYMGLSICYPSRYAYSLEDINKMDETIGIFEKKHLIEYHQFKEPPKITLEIKKAKFKNVLQSFEDSEVVFELKPDEPQSIVIFGREYPLPKLLQFFKGFYLKVVSQEDLGNGYISCDFEVFPKDDFEFRIEYGEEASL